MSTRWTSSPLRARYAAMMLPTGPAPIMPILRFAISPPQRPNCAAIIEKPPVFVKKREQASFFRKKMPVLFFVGLTEKVREGILDFNNLHKYKSEEVTELLNNMTWRFLVIESEPAFLTSDNPVFYFEGMGLNKPESELSFPISSNIVLWSTWRQDLPEGYFQTNKQVVKEMNRRMAQNASRYIFYASEKKWIMPFIKKNEWHLNKIR